MKNKDLLPLISATQDNDVLVKGYNSDDFLSRLIMKFLSEETNTNNDVDLNSLSTDLSYAIKQLERAKAAVDIEERKDREAKKAQERYFDVEVMRIGYGYSTIRVRAISEEEANEKALDEAGDHDFSEKSSDYKIAE
jgi:hypothetical protein